MKKFLPFLGLLALMACSKSKQTEITPESVGSKKIAVNFGFSGFSESLSNLSASGITVNGIKKINDIPVSNTSISKLMLIIYDKDGSQVDRFEQDRNTANKTFNISNDKKVISNSTNAFGTITDSLAAGNYTVVAIGAPFSASLNRKNEGTVDANNPVAYPIATLANAKFWSDSNYGNDEYYYYKGSLAVVAGNAPAQTIALKHVVGEVYLQVTDSIPKSAVKASFIVRNDASSFRISTSAPEDKFDSTIVPVPFDITGLGGKLGVTISVLNTVTPVTVEVKIYDAKNNVIISKSIPNITVPVGKIVTLTGNLFTGYSNSLSTISVTGDGTFTYGDTIHF